MTGIMTMLTGMNSKMDALQKDMTDVKDSFSELKEQVQGLTPAESTTPSRRRPKVIFKPKPSLKRMQLLDLEEEDLVKVLSYLPMEDLINGVRKTCRSLHRLSFSPDLWRYVEVRGRDVEEEKFFWKFYHGTCMFPFKLSFRPGHWKYVAVRGRDVDEENICRKLFRQKCLVPDKKHWVCSEGDQGRSAEGETGDFAEGEAGDFAEGEAGDFAEGEAGDFAEGGAGDFAGGGSGEVSDMLKLELGTGGSGAAHHRGGGGDGASGVELRCMVRALREFADVPPSCSVTGHMVFPNLRELTLVTRVPMPRVDCLARYTALHSLCIRVLPEQGMWFSKTLEDKPFMARCFDILKELKELQTLDLTTTCGQWLDDSITKSVCGYFQSGPKLKCLHLNLGQSVSCDDIVKMVLEHCLQLQDLRLLWMNLTTAAFAKAAESPKESLSALLIRTYTPLDDGHLKAIACAFPRITKLELDLDEKASDEGMGVLVKACSSSLIHLTLNLEEKDWRDSDSVSVENTSHAVGYGLLERSCQKGKLQTLELMNFQRFPCFSFDDIFKNQPNLRTVTLEICQVDFLIMSVLTLRCPRLERLDLYHCLRVRLGLVIFLIEKLPRLWCLEVKSTTLGSLGPFEVADISQQVNKESRLRKMTLGPCDDLCVTGLSTLTQACPNLVELTLYECFSFDDECFTVLLINCVHLRLLFLDIWSGFNKEISLTDASLRDIQTLGSQLETVSIRSCRTFTSAALARAVLHTPRLTEFSLRTSVGRRHTVQHLVDLRRSLLTYLRQLPAKQQKKVVKFSAAVDAEAKPQVKTLDFGIVRLRSRTGATHQLCWQKDPVVFV
ncbi:hypothetical protein ACOMHN_014276 [Nucella lapillus]